jgi:dTDP-4-amino-4,6-dideoxygalactose transaminase
LDAASQKLAIDGGPRALAHGPPAWPRQDPAILAALEEAWKDGSWGRYQGRHEERLVAALTELQQVPHVLLCCSGTFAVELALRGLKVAAADEVILAGYDFPGNFRAVEAIGAIPVLVDIGPDNWTPEPAAVASAIGPKTRAILVSHLHGGMADMAGLRAVADRQGIPLVEDACQAPGASILGRPAGSWGDVGVLSFGGSKLLTAGRGGAIITRDPDIHQRAKIHCQRGNDAFPLSELQAAVLLPQIEALDRSNAQRRGAVGRLLRHIATIPGMRPLVNSAQPAEPSFYKLGFHYESKAVGDCPIARFVALVQAEGIPLDRGFRGFALRSDRRCRQADGLPNSRRAADSTLVLHHPILLEPPDVLMALGDGIAKVCRSINTA